MAKSEELRVEALRLAVKMAIHSKISKSVTDAAEDYYKWLKGITKGEDTPPDPGQID